MHRSTNRFLTTHTGSLPRPKAVQDSLRDPSASASELSEVLGYAVWKVVARQVAVGLDIVSDGEQGRTSYVGHLLTHWGGFGGESGPVDVADLRDYPGAAGALGNDPGFQAFASRPACIGPIVPSASPAIQADLARLSATLDDSAYESTEAVMTLPSPGAIAMFFDNQYYSSQEEYLGAIAEALRPEYEAVVAAGFTLQVDSPDQACPHVMYPDASLEEASRQRDLQIAALNDALIGVDAEDARMHVCWGNYIGPHHRDVELVDIVDQVLRAKPAGLMLEAANPRHEHEWRLWTEVALPDNKVLVPGVIDTVNTTIEHPELVAQRIEDFAQVVGRERVVPGTDCGFGTLLGMSFVDADVAYAKLQSLVDGAELASKRCY